ncbi:MAG TPA: hypothetical protein ENH62_06720 [Marinobacter sp.]|uniref:Uncharacterized protein n=1 Tax=marine sediment metagenome TaxID=412755 RepID=A0A0F9SPH2_9ZZZZ|nr:hypothetical protein [Marinobacter sp.]
MAKRKKAAKKKAQKKVAKKKTTNVHVVSAGRSLDVPKNLYDRAIKKVGLDDSRIVAFPTAAALKKFCDKAHMASNPDARPQVAEIPPPEPKAVLEPPDKVEFDSKLEAQFITTNRASFDNNTLQAEMRKVNRKHGTQKPVRITTDQACKAVDGKDERGISVKYLITHFVVYYK